MHNQYAVLFSNDPVPRLKKIKIVSCEVDSLLDKYHSKKRSIPAQILVQF